jgi:uncharacterized protein YdhG (YjbR/CyaY superfamily)
MAMPKHETVADHDAACSDVGRAALAQVRAVIDDLVPADLPREERMSYNLPTLFVGGKRVVHYAAWDAHLALYPVPLATSADPTLVDDLAPFIKGKGTLHFPYAVLSPPGAGPFSLISRVVAAHLARIGIDVAPSEEPA